MEIKTVGKRGKVEILTRKEINTCLSLLYKITDKHQNKKCRAAGARNSDDLNLIYLIIFYENKQTI